MPIRKIFFCVILSCALVKSKAQDSCIQQQALCLQKIIKNSISKDGESYAKLLSEYFIIDIKLNIGRDSIINIDFYKKDKSYHFQHIEKVIKKIEDFWKPRACDYDRILIPVFILFSSADELYDYPIEFALKSITDGANNKVYLLNTIIINVSSRVKKKL